MDPASYQDHTGSTHFPMKKMTMVLLMKVVTLVSCKDGSRLLFTGAKLIMVLLMKLVDPEF